MKWVKIIKNKFFIVGTLFAIWIIFFDQSNLIDWGGAIIDVRKQKFEKQYYEQQITRTREKLRELQSNRDSLEKFARETYFYLEDNEEVFIIR